MSSLVSYKLQILIHQMSTPERFLIRYGTTNATDTLCFVKLYCQQDEEDSLSYCDE